MHWANGVLWSHFQKILTTQFKILLSTRAHVIRCLRHHLMPKHSRLLMFSRLPCDDPCIWYLEQCGTKTEVVNLLFGHPIYIYMYKARYTQANHRRIKQFVLGARLINFLRTWGEQRTPGASNSLCVCAKNRPISVRGEWYANHCAIHTTRIWFANHSACSCIQGFRSYNTGRTFEPIFMKFTWLVRIHPWMNPIVFKNNWLNSTTDMEKNVLPKAVFWV